MNIVTLKKCFEEYVSHYEKYIGNAHDITSETIDNMSIHDIDSIVQLSFICYVTKCRERVDQYSIHFTLYKHINTLIRQYIQDHSPRAADELREILAKQKTNIALVEANQEIPVTPVEEKHRGWFF